MTAVFGSGFGLYGHLPALVELGQEVFIPDRYRLAFEGRPELAPYRSAVHFSDETTLLSTAALAVLARRPADNEALARESLRSRHPLQLVIEKPPAPMPDAAIALAAELREAGLRSSVPYLFPHCDWAQECQTSVALGHVRQITLNWRFQSRNPPETWKTAQQQGGGLLSYYFIHVIALAQFFLGDCHLRECQATNDGSDQGVRMVAANGSTQFFATFFVTSADSEFSVALDRTPAIASATPFGRIPRRGDRDPRIDVLKRFYAREVLSAAPDESAQRRADWTLRAWAEIAGLLNRHSVMAC